MTRLTKRLSGCNERARQRWADSLTKNPGLCGGDPQTDRSVTPVTLVPAPMVVLIGIAAAAAGAVLAFWFTRSAAQRQLADQRAALAAELATARRDNEWLSGQ